jgi:hypothetical protein
MSLCPKKLPCNSDENRPSDEVIVFNVLIIIIMILVWDSLLLLRSETATAHFYAVFGLTPSNQREIIVLTNFTLLAR